MKRMIISLLAVLISMTAAIAESSENGNEKSENGRTTSPVVTQATVFLLPDKVQDWKYGSSERRAWETQGYNQWGGHDLSCISPLYAVCGLWDWRTIYPADKPTAEIPSETRCAAYGDGLVRAAAVESQITLPEDLPTPTYEESGF